MDTYDRIDANKLKITKRTTHYKKRLDLLNEKEFIQSQLQYFEMQLQNIEKQLKILDKKE